MRRLFLRIFLCISVIGQAQVDKGYDTQSNFNQYVASGGGASTVVRQLKPRTEGVVGTPFLSDQFITGTITLTSNQVFYPVKINLDLIEDELLVQTDDNTPPLVLDKQKVQKFSLEFRKDSIVFFGKIRYPKDIIYAQRVAQNDSIEIYMRRLKLVKKADNSGPYSRGTNFDQIYEEDEFIWRDIKSGEAKHINTKKNQLLKLFPGQESKLNSYLKSAPYSVRKVQGLNDLFRYMIGPPR